MAETLDNLQNSPTELNVPTIIDHIDLIDDDDDDDEEEDEEEDDNAEENQFFCDNESEIIENTEDSNVDINIETFGIDELTEIDLQQESLREIKEEYEQEDIGEPDLNNVNFIADDLHDDDPLLHQFELKEEPDSIDHCDKEDADSLYELSNEEENGSSDDSDYSLYLSDEIEKPAPKKTRKRRIQFEANPKLRKKHQRRLLEVLNDTIYEYTHRIGHQAIILIAAPDKATPHFAVFGARPLRNVVENLKDVVMQELRYALKEETDIAASSARPSNFELPPLIIDGVPVPVERMTQSQLRAFIPLMLKYSTGRGKPGWGRDSMKPKWWPKGLPWANVRMDARTDDEKQKTSWTEALRKIVKNCYKYHGRCDLLPSVSEFKGFNKRSCSNSDDSSDVDIFGQMPTLRPLPKSNENVTKVIHSTNLVKLLNPTPTTRTLLRLPDGRLVLLQPTATNTPVLQPQPPPPPQYQLPSKSSERIDVFIPSTKPSECVDEKITIDLTDEPDDDDDDIVPNISNMQTQQDTKNMVIIPSSSDKCTTQSGSIYLAAAKNSGSKLFTIPATININTNSTNNKQKVVQLVTLTE